jgi:hypothetical protein
MAYEVALEHWRPLEECWTHLIERLLWDPCLLDVHAL